MNKDLKGGAFQLSVLPQVCFLSAELGFSVLSSILLIAKPPMSLIASQGASRHAMQPSILKNGPSAHSPIKRASAIFPPLCFSNFSHPHSPGGLRKSMVIRDCGDRRTLCTSFCLSCFHRVAVVSKLEYSYLTSSSVNSRPPFISEVRAH